MQLRVKGVYTVEAAFVIGIITIIILYMVAGTLTLYNRIAQYAAQIINDLGTDFGEIELIRVERIFYRLLKQGAE